MACIAVALRGRRVCFADEGGLARRCSTLCVAVLCFEVEGSALHAGREVLEEVRRLLGIVSGEVKFRVVKRASRRRGVRLEEVMDLILSRCVGYGCACSHIEYEERLQKLKVELLVRAAGEAGARGSTLFLDEGLLPSRDSVLGRVRESVGAVYVKLRPSHRTPGVQLADVYAGFCASRG